MSGKAHPANGQAYGHQSRPGEPRTHFCQKSRDGDFDRRQGDGTVGPPVGAARAASGDNQRRASQEYGLAQVVAAGGQNKRALTKDSTDRLRGGMPQARTGAGFFVGETGGPAAKKILA